MFFVYALWAYKYPGMGTKTMSSVLATVINVWGLAVKNFDKCPHRCQTILRRNQDRGKAVDDGHVRVRGPGHCQGHGRGHGRRLLRHDLDSGAIFWRRCGLLPKFFDLLSSIFESDV